MSSLYRTVNQYHLLLIKLFNVNNDSNNLPLIELLTVNNNYLPLIKIFTVNNYLPLIKLLTVNKNING